MPRTLLFSLDANECREIVAADGTVEGMVIGYVIRQEWFDSDLPWAAFSRRATFDLAWLGRFATPDEAARRVTG